MRKYERPLMIMEEFTPNQAIASCETISNDVAFTCMQGATTPSTDTLNVLADVYGSTCSTYPKKVGSTVSNPNAQRKPGGGTYGDQRYNEKGWFVICVNNNKSKSNTSYWSDNGVHIKTNDHKQWHCLAAPYETVATKENLS